MGPHYEVSQGTISFPRRIYIFRGVYVPECVFPYNSYVRYPKTVPFGVKHVGGGQGIEVFLSLGRDISVAVEWTAQVRLEKVADFCFLRPTRETLNMAKMGFAVGNHDSDFFTGKNAKRWTRWRSVENVERVLVYMIEIISN